MSLKLLESRWLLRDDSLPWTINGIPVDPATRTRREEYHWAFDQCRGTELLDAATGYIYKWHMLPYILTARHTHRHVTAIDYDQQTLKMPPTQNVVRLLGDLMRLPFADASFDTVFCISTLEHLSYPQQAAAAEELLRVCKPGGRLVLTADEAPWLPNLFGFPGGDPQPSQPALSPAVYATVLEK